MFFSVVALLLTKALLAELCNGLNVTVTPGPVAMVTVGDNLTVSCLVSQRKRTSSVLVLRWLFSPPPSSPPPPPPPRVPPSPSPVILPTDLLIVKLSMKRTKVYGNYTRGFPQPKFLLFEEREGEVYPLLVLNVSAVDQGSYTCRVQEIRRFRNSWRASSNGTASTHLTVHATPADSGEDAVWRWFADVYLCAVMICSLGLLSIFLFTLTLACQHLQNRHRLKAASYYLVKCPESSSGETVTSSVSSSSSSPGSHRKPKPLPRDTSTAPPGARMPAEPPPPPATVPVSLQRPRKPRRLKSPPRRSVTPRVCEDDSLTYAELELVRPRPDPIPASRGPGLTPDPAASSPDTVYAQILFQEKQL